MVLRATLPKGLIASTFERYDPNRQGGKVPIHFVPEVIPPPDEKQGKSATVKFKSSSIAKKMYKVLLEGGTEAFNNHIKVHKTILSDISVKAEAVATHALMVENRRTIADLTVADPSTNQAQIVDLVTANHELADTVRTSQKDAFEYFEKILLPELAVKWQLIVEEEAVGVDYVSVTGIKPGNSRGKDLLTFNPAISGL